VERHYEEEKVHGVLAFPIKQNNLFVVPIKSVRPICPPPIHTIICFQTVF
jgi:hypothetical protein